MKDNSELGYGVFYKPSDYANLIKRIIIAIVDFCVLMLLWIAGMAIWFAINQNTVDLPKYIFLILIALTFWYLGILKASKFRTLGYIIANVKIVDLKGNKPSAFKMMLRVLLLLLGPLGFIFDLIWLTGEETKQTFRDKYVGTYVVRNKAKPIGKGKQRITKFNVVFWHFMFREVEKS